MNSQQLFNYIFTTFLFFIKFFVKGIIYFPFLFCGYVCAKFIMHRNDNGLVWMALIISFAGLIYFIFHLLVVKMNNHKSTNNLCWVPLFIFCIAFTCILPVYIVFTPLENVIRKLTSGSNAVLLTWIFSLAFGFFVFSRYPFFKS
jgi:hypothetical protein